MSGHLPPIDAWRPLSVEEAAASFAPLGVPWWVAGGWAIDLFLGRQTREHADMDLAMLRGQEPELDRLRGEFDLYVAHRGAFIPWHGGPLAAEHHQFWARRAGDDAWAFEVLLEHRDGEHWIYRRDPRVRRPLSEFGARTDAGVPYVRPGVALLYKSNRPELERNARDVNVALETLPRGERAWLRGALALCAPGHPWLRRLAD